MTQRRFFWHNPHFFWHNVNLRKHYLINVFFGIMIAVAFAWCASSQWGEGLRNAAFDMLARYEYPNLSDTAPGSSRMFFVEITPAQYRQWGEPLLAPRDRLADLIETAWKKGAPVVVLDVLLDRPDREHPAGDVRLRRLLERMLRENARTKVVFPVRIGAEGDLRPHLFDDLMERRTGDGERLFYPAVPTVLASDRDLLNRFWDLYQVGRDRSGQLRVLWSVELLASALHAGTQDGLDQLASALVAGVEGGAGHAGGSPEQGLGHAGGSPVHGLALRLGGRELHLPPLQRSDLPGAAHPGYQAAESHGLPYTQRIRFLIRPQTLAKRDAENFRPGLSPDSLAGKIVVIGNSSPETGDVLATPVEKAMPGMYLLGNAINTITTDRMPVHLSVLPHLAVEAFIIVIAAWMFLRVHSVLAQFLLSAGCILLFVPISWLIYQRWGLFFNFIVPVAGMRLHSLADGIESMVMARGRKHHDLH